MQDPAQDDDRVMGLVERAMARPAGQREPYLRTACGPDADLFDRAWSYVQWEERMEGFLAEPFPDSAPSEQLFESGELLDGRFRIVREVARGGMGVVYEAIDEKLDRRIALKCAKAGFGHRLPPEVRNATTVSHPNVCKIYEIHTADTPHGKIDFFTMEYLDGDTLAGKLLRGPLAEAEARDIAAQLCAGLDEAHRNQIIHGDLKSSNVILAYTADGAPRAVITDFGLARKPGAAHRGPSGPAGGTPDYMAPELWQGGKATVASDLYALGVILHELILGSRPAAGSGSAAAPARWRRAIRRCLDPDPARRFPSAAAVAKALAPVSRRWLWGAAAAAALAAVSGLLTYHRATAPVETVRLAVLPLEAAPDAAELAAAVSAKAGAHIGQLRGSRRTRLGVIPADVVLKRKVSTGATAREILGATHVLRGTLRLDAGRHVLHGFVTDTGSQANAADREFRYEANELHYAGQALAGMVSFAFRLTPAEAAAVSDLARDDYRSGVAYTRTNSTVDKALPLLQRAVEADPDSPLTWAGLAEAQWFKYSVTQDRAWFDRAAESLRQAQNRNLDAAAVHRIAGVFRASAGAYEEAVAEYLRAIELEPVNGDAWRRLGQAYERNNQLGPALASFQKAVELEPGYFKVYQDLGSYYSHRGDFTQAIRQFEQCARVAPDEPDAHYVLGTAFLNAGRYAESETELRAAIRLGETPRALNNLAAALMYQDKDRDAIPVLIRAIDRSPARYLWWMNLGDAYRRTGLPVDAARAYRRCLDLAEQEMARDPRAGDVRSRVAYVCARLGERRRAESEIAQALRLSPESTDTLQTAVWTFEALGKRNEALALVQSFPDRALPDVLRSRDLAGLREDSCFQQWVQTRRSNQELSK